MADSAVKVVLLDIEGTVCPISFVKDVLFPYALHALPGTLRTQWDSPEFAQYRAAFPSEYSGTPSNFSEHVKDLMSRDVKISYLKSLQGYLWENGYRTGELKAPLFPDVAPKFKTWTENGKKIVIYSSGSVPAQKLLFEHTDAEPANLIPMISDFFDTVNAGPKTEQSSFEKIMGKYSQSFAPSDWLFLSDNVKEVEAAKQAGMQSVIVQRPGNPPLAADIETRHRVITNFNDLD